jgi:hypothetical protein
MTLRSVWERRFRPRAIGRASREEVMRRLAVVLAVFSIALVAVPAAFSKAPKGDSAFGSGVRAPSCTLGCPAGPFSFNATSGANGENAGGTFVIDFPGFAGFTGNVTCLNVSGHQATISGQISSGTGAADPSTFTTDNEALYFVGVVSDNGTAKKGKPSPDQMSLVAWDTQADWADPASNPPGFTLGQLCTDPFAALGTSNMLGLVSGDLTVINN